MKESTTKQKVIDAASILFFRNGFHGTSVRDIAELANANVSLISYYFKSKQGLLEYAVTEYYEEYLRLLEDTYESTATEAPADRLSQLIFTIIQYKHENHQLTSFIHHELSLDSIFVREMAVTYLAKEDYFLQKIFRQYIGTNVEAYQEQLLFLQFKGMLITPYILHRDWKEQTVGEHAHHAFVKNYVRVIVDWFGKMAS